jgi:hypothetical protein
VDELRKENVVWMPYKKFLTPEENRALQLAKKRRQKEHEEFCRKQGKVMTENLNRAAQENRECMAEQRAHRFRR